MEETFKDRLIKEQDDLLVKVIKLESFLNNTEKTKDIAPEQLFLLSSQLLAMKQYNLILVERLRILN